MRTGSLIILRKVFIATLVSILAPAVFAQAGPSGATRNTAEKPVNLDVKQVDEVTVKPLLVPKGKPLIVNFWATWCEPCRKEFPELIEIDKEYAGKIDFRIISLDDPVEINRDVPKFLKDQGSTMDPYLLRTPDETEVIGSISSEWQGGLPFTVLYGADGKILYARQGKIKVPVVRGILEQVLGKPDAIAVTETVKILNGKRDEAVFYYRNNWMKLREEALKRGFIRSYEMMVAEPEENSDFDIILVTRYADRKQYDDSEERFQMLIRQLSPEGPTLMNSARPPEFRKSAGVKVAESVLAGN